MNRSSFSRLELENAAMSMRQDIDVSSFAAEIDGGARTFLLDFDWFDNDAVDQGVVTISFLDGSGNSVGYPSVYRTMDTTRWTHARQLSYPMVGTRTIRITVAADKVGTGNSTVRNIAFDDFVGRLVDFDSDKPDPWEMEYGFDIDDSADAAISYDEDTLTNLEEFLNDTHPYIGDTDGDGINDDVEVATGTDPLDANSPGSDVKLVNLILTKDGSGQVTQGEVIFSGLLPGTPYILMRGTDLQSFPDTADSHQPASSTGSFFDSNPPVGKAFYRLETP